MFNQETSSDLLVIHHNRIIFRSGQGRLTKHSKISASVTQVLTLFSERIMNGEQIHFIRFEGHRMIFLFSPDEKEEKLVAIVLIPNVKSARQVIPAMNIVLRLLDEFLKGNITDAQNQQLDCFYQILSAPENSLIVAPRTAEGILSALVILTAFAHDMHLGLQKIISNIQFVDPTDVHKLREISQRSTNTRILSFIHLPEVSSSEHVITFGLESHSRQFFSALPGEEVYDVIGRIFGDKSNAAKMRGFIANEEAREIAQSASLLPRTEDDYIRKEILLSTVLQPGKDIIVTLSTPIMQKLRELSASVPVIEETPTIEETATIEKTPTIEETATIEKTPTIEETPTIEGIPDVSDLEKLLMEPQEVAAETVPAHPQISEVDSLTEIELSAEPDAIPKEMQELSTSRVSTVAFEEIDSEVLTRLDETRKKGFAYRFDSIPLILDTAPFEMNMQDTQNLPYDESEITLRLFSGGDNHFSVHIYSVLSRLPYLRDSLEDLAVKIGGATHQRENHIFLIGPIENLQTTLRALLWLCIVEYLEQIKLEIQKPSQLFEIPKEGSILIIPPKRDYIKEKIPSKFKSFIEEKNIRDQFEETALWTLGKAQNEILKQLMDPLKKGSGVVFVSSNSNQEMEEISLFLLFISDICGIGFSRW